MYPHMRIFVIGPIYHSSPCRIPSVVPMLSAWMVDGPIRPDKSIVKAHSSSILIGFCTSNSASIVPYVAYHGSFCRSQAAPPLNHKPHLVLRLLSTNHRKQCTHGNLPLSCPIAATSSLLLMTPLFHFAGSYNI